MNEYQVCYGDNLDPFVSEMSKTFKELSKKEEVDLKEVVQKKDSELNYYLEEHPILDEITSELLRNEEILDEYRNNLDCENFGEELENENYDEYKEEIEENIKKDLFLKVKYRLKAN